MVHRMIKDNENLDCTKKNLLREYFKFKNSVNYFVSRLRAIKKFCVAQYYQLMYLKDFCSTSHVDKLQQIRTLQAKKQTFI